MKDDKFKALVLRVTELSDTSSLLTVLTDTRGKKLITCHGSKKLTGRNMSALQPFCFSEMTTSEKNGRLTLREASLIESFFGLRSDLMTAALGMYMAELSIECAREEEDEKELLQLLLNCLYAANKQFCPPDKIKTSFELRLLSISGSAPAYDSCACCGKALDGKVFFSLSEGGVICESCEKTAAEDNILPIDDNARAALSYILLCPPKRLLSYSIPPKSEAHLYKIAEESILYFFEHNFETLRFYNKMKGELPDTE